MFVGSAEDKYAQEVDRSLTFTSFVCTADEDQCIDDDDKSVGGHVPVGSWIDMSEPEV